MAREKFKDCLLCGAAASSAFTQPTRPLQPIAAGPHRRTEALLTPPTRLRQRSAQ